VLPRLDRSFALDFCKAMLFFGSLVFLLCALSLGFGALGLCFGLASGFFGSSPFLVGSPSFFVGMSLFLLETQLEALDFSGTFQPCAVSLDRLSVLFLGSLVLARCSLLLPIGALAFVFYALPGFGYPCGVQLTLCVLMLGAFEFLFGALAVGLGLGLDLFCALTLLVGSLPFGIGAQPLRFRSDMDLLGAGAFGSEFVLERCHSLGTEE
jgi:hypothetical protein